MKCKVFTTIGDWHYIVVNKDNSFCFHSPFFLRKYLIVLAPTLYAFKLSATEKTKTFYQVNI